MNLIEYTVNSSNYIKDWTQSRTLSQIVDAFTYDPYETDNPLRFDYSSIDNIRNKTIKQSANVAQHVGAEILSAYINPYYLSHKMVNLPYNIAELYKKYSFSSGVNK